MCLVLFVMCLLQGRLLHFERMTQLISIAIETSCRRGGVALGIGERLADKIDFDAGARHATHLVVRLRELLGRHGLRAADVNEVYVSAGPGSFTGVRVGITVARTLAQAVAALRCVSVPSVSAVAENASALPWRHLGVILDAKDELVYAQLFGRATSSDMGGGHPWPPPSDATGDSTRRDAAARDGRRAIVPRGEPAVLPFAEFLAAAPKPLLLTGEGLIYHKIAANGEVTLADPSIYYPTAQGVWTVGRRLAGEGAFTEYHRLLPIYARRSEAERLWELRHGS